MLRLSPPRLTHKHSRVCSLVALVCMSGCYAVKGPFGTGQAVHEGLTEEAVTKAYERVHHRAPTSAELADFVYGARWNDDPLGELTSDGRSVRDALAAVAAWGLDLTRAMSEQRLGRQIGPTDSLPSRSHVGDMQFLHAMKSADLEPVDTQHQIFDWCEFAWTLTAVNPASDVSLKDHLNPIISSLWIRYPDVTAERLFGVYRPASGEPGLRSQRLARIAVGSILHILQDSYAPQHTQRVGDPSLRRGPIIQFYDYSTQDKREHADQDEWAKSAFWSSRACRIARTPGAKDSVAYGAQIVELFLREADWDTVRADVLEHAFALVP